MRYQTIKPFSRAAWGPRGLRGSLLGHDGQPGDTEWGTA
jgi:hypothetical protein